MNGKRAIEAGLAVLAIGAIALPLTGSLAHAQQPQTPPPPMPMGGPPAIATDGKFVFVVVGNRLEKLNADTLEVVKAADVTPGPPPNTLPPTTTGGGAGTTGAATTGGATTGN